MSFSQSKISGKITDKNTGDKIPFVSVLSPSGAGTTSDENGLYTLNISSTNKSLTFSYLGYKTQVIQINNRSVINVSLEESDTSLNEIVVTALGLNKKTKELGYVVQELKSEDVTEIKTPNFLDNLAGKLAGVTITQGATGVGS